MWSRGYAGLGMATGSMRRPSIARSEWQITDRRYFSEQSMTEMTTMLNTPEPGPAATVLPAF